MGIRVLIKGMNKVVSFPAETKMEVIETSIKGNWANVEKMSGLPMDTASRMERAKFLGFDVDKTYYHGSKADIKSFDSSRVRAKVRLFSSKKVLYALVFLPLISTMGKSLALFGSRIN